MTRQEINYNKIVSIIKGDAAVAAITDKFTFGEPVTAPAGIHCVLSQITDQPFEDVFWARVEFRFIGADQNTTFTELKDLSKAVKDVVLNRVDFDGFKCRSVTQGSASPNMRGENNIPIFAIDIIFEYDYFV